METQWSKWLAQLARDMKGGITARAIQRGGEYVLRLSWPGDVTGDAFAASVSLSPDGTPVEDFAVSVGAYADGKTSITFTLTEAQTSALAADGDGDGLSEVLFDILRTPAGGTQYRAIAGRIPISGQITEYGA